MASDYKVLGQVAPAATTNTDVYTVPAATKAVVSTIVIANHASTSATYRLAVRPDGATIEQKHYIAYDVPIGGNDSTALTIGVTADASDVITAYCSTSNLSINIFGTEVTT